MRCLPNTQCHVCLFSTIHILSRSHQTDLASEPLWRQRSKCAQAHASDPCTYQQRCDSMFLDVLSVASLPQQKQKAKGNATTPMRSIVHWHARKSDPAQLASAGIPRTMTGQTRPLSRYVQVAANTLRSAQQPAITTQYCWELGPKNDSGQLVLTSPHSTEWIGTLQREPCSGPQKAAEQLCMRLAGAPQDVRQGLVQLAEIHLTGMHAQELGNLTLVLLQVQVARKLKLGRGIVR